MCGLLNEAALGRFCFDSVTRAIVIRYQLEIQFSKVKPSTRETSPVFAVTRMSELARA